MRGDERNGEPVSNLSAQALAGPDADVEAGQADIVELVGGEHGDRAQAQVFQDLGADADLAVFDPARITDQATYTSSTRPSSGITHVIVDGTFVVRDGALVPDALPGRPIRAEPR